MWIGKLYGIICLALSQHQSTRDLPETKAWVDEIIQNYSVKIGQCLVLGKYQECPPDTIETLCFTLNIQLMQSKDAHVDNLVILGVIVRIAQRMGYHRDASHFPHISPFQGEMRRRIWALVCDMDILFSSSAGIPRLLRQNQSDTAPPRNLLDEDFDEDTIELPPSRPSSFDNPCQWLVSKNKMISMLGIIFDFSTSIRRPGYGEVMHMDKALHETHKSLPGQYHEKPMSKSIMDSPELILCRIKIVLLLEKSRCVLHYRYLAPSRTDERYSHSRNTCIGASLHILEYHRLVHEEAQPGGRLYAQRWKINSHVFRGEFFLATTLLCLELNFDLSNNNPKHIPLAEDLRHRMIQALQKSYTIWMRSSGPSNDAKRTLQALDLIFTKLPDGEKNATSQATLDSVTATGFEADPYMKNGTCPPEFTSLHHCHTSSRTS